MKIRIFFAAILASASLLQANPSGLDGVLTYSNRPLGSPELPLLLRTFMPDPGLGSEVLGRHDRGANSPKYDPRKGKDKPGEYKPIAGLPAAIGVNYGGALSYCWDAVECRLLYAWNGGFLDMESYWGNPQRGNRQSYGYVPHLVGTVFYQAAGKDPLQIGGKSISDLPDPPKFRGYQRIGKRVIFKFAVADAEVQCEITLGKAEHSLVIRYQLEGKGTIGYQSGIAGSTVKKISNNELLVTIQGSKVAEYNGKPNQNLLKGGVNAESGKRVFAAMACATCHSLDGSKSHGPSLLGLHGSERKIKGAKKPVTADDNYILESIQNPNAKVVEGYPENYMPPYQLKKDEYQALLLYIKSVKNK